MRVEGEKLLITLTTGILGHVSQINTQRINIQVCILLLPMHLLQYYYSTRFRIEFGFGWDKSVMCLCMELAFHVVIQPILPWLWA